MFYIGHVTKGDPRAEVVSQVGEGGGPFRDATDGLHREIAELKRENARLKTQRVSLSVPWWWVSTTIGVGAGLVIVAVFCFIAPPLNMKQVFADVAQCASPIAAQPKPRRWGPATIPKISAESAVWEEVAVDFVQTQVAAGQKSSWESGKWDCDGTKQNYFLYFTTDGGTADAAQLALEYHGLLGHEVLAGSKSFGGRR
jgi:hypothetical protein